MKVVCVVEEPMYTKNGKWYLGVVLGDADAQTVRGIHSRLNLERPGTLIDPLVQNVLTLKVPFRYNRVTCTVVGIKTVQEFAVGETVLLEITMCGVWEGNGYFGPTWKLVSLQSHP
jgi:hypothetical protein